MADIALAIFAVHLRRQILVHRLDQRVGDVEHAEPSARAHVEIVVIHRIAFHGEHVRLDDVAHVREVPALQAVLEHQRSIVVQQPGSKDRRDARVWVGKRLPLSIDIEITQRHRRYSVGTSDSQAQFLLIAFTSRVRRGRL